MVRKHEYPLYCGEDVSSKTEIGNVILQGKTKCSQIKCMEKDIFSGCRNSDGDDNEDDANHDNEKDNGADGGDDDNDSEDGGDSDGD